TTTRATSATVAPTTTTTMWTPCQTLPPPSPDPFPASDTELISQSSDGQLAAFPSGMCQGGSSPTAISDDGNYVLFNSQAANLVPGDTNSTWDLFLRDRRAGTTERVDVANDGSQLSGGGGFGYISADGRYVSFWTNSRD